MVVPTRDDVVAAHGRIADLVVRTPLLRHRVDGRDVWFKAEVLQRTGSFKFRGASNFLAALDERDRRHGVVAYSSGNHAQGVAAAAAHFEVPAAIVMPADAPRVKLDRTRELGAEVIQYDRASQDRKAIATATAAERGMTLLPPFDHPLVIAGQGTAGLEIAEELEGEGVDDVAVVVPASGGGLSSGIALAVETSPSIRGVVTAEPATHDDHRRSLIEGRRVEIDPSASSICDALLQPTPGELTWEVNRTRLIGAVVATDEEVRHAMRWAALVLKLVVEPGGAIGLAALLAGRIGLAGRVVVVLSGGNVDTQMLEAALGA